MIRGAEGGGGRGAGGGEGGGGALAAGREGGDVLLELADPVAGALELVDATSRLLAPGEDVVDARAVQAGHLGERGSALLDVLEAGRVAVDVGEVGPEVGRDVGGEVAQLVDPGAERGEGRVARR